MVLNKKKSGYEILQETLCEGWINNLHDGDTNKPFVFYSLEEAIADLQDDYDIMNDEIEEGTREQDELPDIGNFMIICNRTSKAYDLYFEKGKIKYFGPFDYSP